MLYIRNPIVPPAGRFFFYVFVTGSVCLDFTTIQTTGVPRIEVLGLDLKYSRLYILAFSPLAFKLNAMLSATLSLLLTLLPSLPLSLYLLLWALVE